MNEPQKIDLNQKYISLEKHYYFEDKYCQPNLTYNDKLKIKALSDNYCAELWSEYVSESKKHLMLINNPDEWKISNEIKNNYNWQKDWNDDNINAFTENIKPLVDWKDDDTILFFWSKSFGIETNWDIICKYWISFLYDDEANIIINPKSKETLILTVNGIVSIAERL